MRRFLARIGRFFGSRGFLKFVLWTVTVIVLFYVEEDWRGARAWAATKAKWEARGETFDFDRLIPPPVPAGRNLAALPLFKMEPDPDHHGHMAPLTLQHALDQHQEHSALPSGSLGNAARGELPDLPKIRAVVASEYAEAFKGSPALTPLAQFDALYPFVNELREEAAERTDCRFEQVYRFDEPDALYLSLITTQIPLARILAMHAVLALDEKKPDVALGDIHVTLQLADGLRQEPTLVAGLVAVGVNAILLPAIYDGLAMHAWNDGQLATLEDQLGPVDFLAAYQRCLRGETIGLMLPAMEEYRHHPRETMGTVEGESENHSIVDAVARFSSILAWPDGWFDLAKARAVDLGLGAVSFDDPRTHSANPAAVRTLVDGVASQGVPRSAWRFSSETVGPISASAEHFALGQLSVDEARIACALERYRMVRHSYPDSLDALVPEFIPTLPHDVMDGRPYRYIKKPDGTRVIYSVGWNQRDEGGALVFLKDVEGLPRRIDYEQGDWPWVLPK